MLFSMNSVTTTDADADAASTAAAATELESVPTDICLFPCSM